MENDTRLIQASEYAQSGMQELDNLIIREDAAKKMVLVSLLTGENSLLVGPPGGGKSSLSGDLYRLISDIKPEDVVQIPADAELSSMQLIGGRMLSRKMVTVGGDVRQEDTVVDVEGIVKPSTKIIWSDEINRINPYALNSLLGVFEPPHTLVTTAGSLLLPDFVINVSTMNPSENSQATFPITHAQASRHAMGTILGVSSEEERTEITDKIIRQGWEPTPEKVQPIITLQGLKDLREFVVKVVLSDELATRLIELNKTTIETLASENIHEGDGRMAKQMTKTSKGFALISGRTDVDEKAMNQAVRSTVISRLGALKRYSGHEINSIADSVVEK